MIGNTVYRFPETLDQVHKSVCIYTCVSMCDGNVNSNRKWPVSHALTAALSPSCWSVRTHKTATHRQTQLVFLSLMTLAGLRWLCMVFTSTRPHLLFNLTWLPAHPSLLSLLSLHIYSSSFTAPIPSSHFHHRHKVTKMLNLARLVHPPLTYGGQ